MYWCPSQVSPRHPPLPRSYDPKGPLDIAGVASAAALPRVLRSEGSVDIMLDRAGLALDVPLDAESPASETWPLLVALALDSSDRLES